MYPLTSAESMATAEAAGDNTITRAADLDFLFPIQP